MESLRSLIEKHGKENCVFMLPEHWYNKSNSCEGFIKGTITEKRYKISDNYKIGLKLQSHNRDSESFYITDLQSMIEKGLVEMYVKIS